jgi:hypothetical protein
MADPAVIPCPADTWVKVVTNVVTGLIWRMTVGPQYYHTYRLTGTAAPTDLTDAVPIFRNEESDYEQISANEGIDVYIYARGKAGKVRVDV